jgi:hypothetical protein
MKKLSLIFVVLLGLLPSCNSVKGGNNSVPMQSTRDGWTCISTFNNFVYQMVKIDRNDERYKLSDIYPSYPWELSAEIPESVSNDVSHKVVRTNIELTRIYSGQTELWIRSGGNIIRHNVGSDNFSIIPASPYDKNGKTYEDVEVRSLFEIATGEIIGVNYPENYDTVWQEAIPLFSVYSEAENKFGFYDIGLKYRDQQVGFGYVGMIPRDGVIISRSDSLIWIYQQQDGLYSYNPVDSGLQHYETSFDGIIQRMVASQEGFLLFSQKKEESWKLSPGELVKYYPSSQTIEEITVPFFRWADYGTLLYTNSGDLWIGIHGYLSKDGTWVLKNPNRLAYINLGFESKSYNWVQPKLIFQSSNGYLWYTNETGDGLGVDGSAWYDPVSETGCWFTTESGNIAEDSQKNLWMVTGRKIYEYSTSK